MDAPRLIAALGDLALATEGGERRFSPEAVNELLAFVLLTQAAPVELAELPPALVAVVAHTLAAAQVEPSDDAAELRRKIADHYRAALIDPELRRGFERLLADHPLEVRGEPFQLPVEHVSTVLREAEIASLDTSSNPGVRALLDSRHELGGAAFPGGRYALQPLNIIWLSTVAIISQSKDQLARTLVHEAMHLGGWQHGPPSEDDFVTLSEQAVAPRAPILIQTGLVERCFRSY